MKGLSRRALACAVTAASGAAMLVGAAAAQAQKPASVGDGVKTGQLSVQMFNYGGYINNGGGTGAANPVTGVSAACLTSTTPACRAERLERLFAFLAVQGRHGHRAVRPLRASRPTATSRASRRTARCSTSTTCTPAAGTAA